jgi:siroheme synthase
VIERATTPAQRVVAGTVGTLPATAKAAGVRPPALIVIGEVVRVRAALAPGLERASAPATLAA